MGTSESINDSIYIPKFEKDNKLEKTNYFMINHYKYQFPLFEGSAKRSMSEKKNI